jgi:hypothetical protein
MRCGRCKRLIDFYKGYWWDADDSFMCPDGEQIHAPMAADLHLLME